MLTRLVCLCWAVSFAICVNGLGVNWGTQAIHPLPPTIVSNLLQDNGFKKVKLFDADQATMSALSGTGMEVMVGIPNNLLASIAGDYSAAKQWVKQNVTRYNFNGGVTIKYVAVGNEPFLSSYNHSFDNVTFPALQNIQNALNDAGLGDKIKATVPQNADVYGTTGGPSGGKFRSDISSVMKSIVQLLSSSGAPFTVNIYPFISLYQDANFPTGYAFFDGTDTVTDSNGIVYKNVFDANFDTLIAALKDVGFPNLPIIVGEVGWPTDGDKNANVVNAKRFYDGLLKKLASNAGTPQRPGYLEVYLFGLIDEDAKSISPGNFERHWGIFTYDGRPKFQMDLAGQDSTKSLVPAKNVKYLPKQWCVIRPDAANLTALGKNIGYACTFSDCTALGYGSTCGGMDTQGNASFAFNMYYQVQYQKETACDFQGLAMVTTQNASQTNCNFTIQIDVSRAWTATQSQSMATATVLLTLFLQFVLYFLL